MNTFYGGNTTAMHWIGSLDDGWTWTEKDCIESDWQNDVHIEGYDAASLEKSCRSGKVSNLDSLCI